MTSQRYDRSYCLPSTAYMHIMVMWPSNNQALKQVVSSRQSVCLYQHYNVYILRYGMFHMKTMHKIPYWNILEQQGPFVTFGLRSIEQYENLQIIQRWSSTKLMERKKKGSEWFRMYKLISVNGFESRLTNIYRWWYSWR